MGRKKEMLVVGAMRSNIGNGRTDSSYLLGVTPQELIKQVLGAMFLRIPIPRPAVKSFTLGSVISLKSSAVTQAFARESALGAELINASSNVAEKACSSGLRAVYEAGYAVSHQNADFAIGAGVDLMSGVDKEINLATLRDPLTNKYMAELSDEKARELGFTRKDYDEYALESYSRAEKHEECYFLENYLTPILVPGKGFSPKIDQNIHFKKITPKLLEKCEPLGGCVITTPYNSSKYGDGCGALLIASPQAARKWRLKPLAKILSYAEYSLGDPKDFIIAPRGAALEALKIAKLSLQDIGSFWVNEAFPGSPLFFMRELGVPWELVNPWGGAIAFGHPLGATGAILCVNAICQGRMERKKYVVVSLCNAIGEATAMVFEIIL